jgi:L-methionine (R)-S-oxide reductase
MDIDQKKARYARIRAQLEEIFAKCEDEEARMASAAALLHHKMSGFFWTGFYRLKDGRLIVKSYQGPIACMELKKDTGVCWSAINSGKTVIVPDVESFPGHIHCDSRSRSEICVPFRDKSGVITAVLDIDSDRLSNFDGTDGEELEKILELIVLV